MKELLLFIFCVADFSFIEWQPDFETAKIIAKEKHRLILLNFSGSDWCVPCIQLRRTIFDDKQFRAMADSNLVMVNADFPRNKKNQLSSAAKMENEKLADRYNPSGRFPLTLLLDADGGVIQSWDGLPGTNAATFAKTIKKICDARK